MNRAFVVGALVVALVGCASGPGQKRKPAIDLSGAVPAVASYQDEDRWHYQYLLDEEELANYDAMTPLEREKFFRLKWASLDPTPTTNLNERFHTHFQRVGYARENFSREEPPGWDKRGELLIRYGPPERRDIRFVDVVEGGGLIPPAETWIYSRLGQAYRLEDPRIQGDYQDAFGLERQQGLASGRNIDAARDQHIRSLGDPDQELREKRAPDLDAEAQIQEQRLTALLNRGQEALDEDPQSYIHDFGGEKLDYVFDVVQFGSEREGRTRIQVNTAFWASDLGYRAAAGGYAATLLSEAALKTEDYLQLDRAVRTTRNEKESIDSLEGQLVMDRLTLDVDPGTYRLALSVRDSVTQKIGVWQTEAFHVKDFGLGLSISDVQLSLGVNSAQPGDEFVRGRYQIVPYPLGTFGRDSDIYLYFEVYGLTPSPTGDLFYSVQFLVRQTEPKSSGWFGSSDKGDFAPGVATSFDGTGRGDFVQDYLIIDPKSLLDDDVYNVVLTVTDRGGTGETVSTSVSFAVRGR